MPQVNQKGPYAEAAVRFCRANTTGSDSVSLYVAFSMGKITSTSIPEGVEVEEGAVEVRALVPEAEAMLAMLASAMTTKDRTEGIMFAIRALVYPKHLYELSRVQFFDGTTSPDAFDLDI